MDVTFHILSIKANGIESSSSLNVGTNLLIGFGSSTKSVHGNSESNGDSGTLPSQCSVVDDRDVLDSPHWEMAGAASTLWPPGQG